VRASERLLSAARRSDRGNGRYASRPRMRIALLSFNFGQYCIRLANGLARCGHVVLLVPRDQVECYRDALDPAVELVEIDLPRLRRPLAQARMVRSVLKALRAHAPDVVHYQAGHMWFNLAWPLYRRTPVVVTIHESRHHLGDLDSKKTPQPIMDIGYRRADRIIVHGEQLRDAVVTDLGRPREIIDVVPTLADLVLGDADPGAPVEGDGRTILFFGRIWEYKGLEYLVRAQPLISERVPDARIVIAGRGEDLERYRALMTDPERFEIHDGYIPDDELVALFRRAAVVVLPYVDGSVSGVVPVACAFGKPVVATTVGILPEMVEHRETGLIVPPRDERALADAIVELLQDDGLRSELGANARRRAETMFDPASVGEQTVAVYERAIAGWKR
jgi:glycosyltransferase involved in cell wall biosynthesis